MPFIERRAIIDESRPAVVLGSRQTFLSRLHAHEHRVVPLLLTATIGFLVTLAWCRRFMTDDAFISFRYADNFVRGNGLVYNLGENVEGYTNFLWTLLHSVPLRFGWDIVVFSYAAGLTIFAATLLVVFFLSRYMLSSSWWALLAVLFLGIHPTFQAFATSGLETMLQTFFIVAAVTLSAQAFIKASGWSKLRLFGISLLTVAGILTRLDTALFFFPLLVIIFIDVVQERRLFSQRLGKIAVLFLPLLITMVWWFSWKLAFYGDVLPNTFYVKGLGLPFTVGLFYLVSFLRSYFLVPVLLVFAVFFLLRFFTQHTKHTRQQKKNRMTVIIRLLLIQGSLWLLYVLFIGGDFMEFRMFVPVLPLLIVSFFFGLRLLVVSPPITFALLIILAGGMVHHVMTFASAQRHGIELAATQADVHWDAVGRFLGQQFSYRQDVLVATTAAGNIPYYSRLSTLDMLGLNDRWVALHGLRHGNRPGHSRIAPPEYLLQRHVNILLNHPEPINAEDYASNPLYHVLAYYFIIPIDPALLPRDALFLAIPLPDQRVLPAIYLYRTPFIDNVIQTQHWSTQSVTNLLRL